MLKKMQNYPLRRRRVLNINNKADISAFTLIELLVVIAIISLLMSILMPVIGAVRSKALQIKCAHNLKQIDLAIRLYQNENNDKYPCADDPVSHNPETDQPIWLWMGRGWRPYIEPCISYTLGAANASILLCPADITDPNKYNSTSYAYSMAFYHSPDQINAMSSISDQAGENNNPFVKSVSQKGSFVTQPDSKIIISEWYSNHYHIDVVQNWYIWEGKRNYLFADSHIAYIETSKLLPANDGLPNPNLTVNGIRGCDLP